MPPVHILVSCRNPELWRASTLVFDTIRKGFPTAQILVQGNDLDRDQASDIYTKCETIRARYIEARPTIHHEWIRTIYSNGTRPFVICDTDVIFHDEVESKLTALYSPEYDYPIFGRLIPAFNCPFVGVPTHERLHTSLMMIAPTRFEERIDETIGNLTSKPEWNWANPFHPGMPELIPPIAYPVHGKLYYHDTMSRAYHLLGGMKFSEDILNCYDHLNCGTYLDLLEERIPGSRARQEEYLRHPEQARGLWKNQQAWYLERAVNIYEHEPLKV